MADVVIKNEYGTNEIFHANKKRISEFDRLKNRENLLQVETPTPSTHQLNGLELTDDNLFGTNALSATDKDIIPQIQNNISESAITRMKQRIENLMQGKGFKGSTKQKSTDKKQDR